jgi:hypothetical protein
MIWLTWRQFRTAGIAVFAVLAALAVVLAVTGPGLSADYTSGLAACTAQDGGCTTFLKQFGDDHEGSFLAVSALILMLPVLIGLFWGAPLVSRELESGTHRLVWNQSVTRTRWLGVKLGVTGLAAIAAAGLGSLTVTWWGSSVDQAVADDFPRLGSFVFDARGIVPIGYAAFAFVLGVTVGMLVRRALPAMAITLAVFVALQVAMPALIRPHLLTPTRETVEFSVSMLNSLGRNRGGPIHISAKAPEPGAWLLSGQTVDPAGNAVDGIPVTSSDLCDPAFGMKKCLDDVNKLGYREQLTYHAASRFWPFQWIETGIYLVLALGVAGFCFWWLRRRLS